MAHRLGIDAALVRVAFVLTALVGGAGVVVYLVAWLVMPMEGQRSGIATRIAGDRRGIALTLALVPALVVVLVVAAALGIGFVTTLAFPTFLCLATGLLIWRNCDAEEREWLRRAVEPAVRLGSPGKSRRRALAIRLVTGAVLLVAGAAVLASRHPGASLLWPVGGVLLVVAAFVVLFGPWWLRIARDLVEERAARARAEDRADMAARVHDSVLQTLAMIQRSADQPHKVVQLARAQERELRSWLFEGETPGSAARSATTLAAGVQLIAAEVEESHETPVEAVTVGDCPLDDRLRAVLAAAREATVNAARWSGAPVVSVYGEVEPGRVSVFVRDRGSGFDPDAIGEDRRGVKESITARMRRIGGEAAIRTAPGKGTEVQLVLSHPSDR